MKSYEVRYYSTMILGMALHSVHADIKAAREAANALYQQVCDSGLDRRDAAQILKSIEVI